MSFLSDGGNGNDYQMSSVTLQPTLVQCNWHCYPANLSNTYEIEDMATAEELNEKKLRTLAKWGEWKAQAEAKGEQPNMTKFVAASKGTDWETNTSSLRIWTGKSAKATGIPKARTTPAPTPALTTIEGMEAAIKRQQDALAQQKKDYVKLLRNEVTRLKAELGKATQKYEEITEGMSQAELDELHNSDSV